MIKYEVNLEIDKTIYSDYMKWLSEHIREMLSIDGFQKANLFEDMSSTTDDDYYKVTVCYQLDTMESLQNYFDHHASLMRSKAIELFGDRFRASRRILMLIRTF